MVGTFFFGLAVQGAVYLSTAQSPKAVDKHIDLPRWHQRAGLRGVPVRYPLGAGLVASRLEVARRGRPPSSPWCSWCYSPSGPNAGPRSWPGPWRCWQSCCWRYRPGAVVPGTSGWYPVYGRLDRIPVQRGPGDAAGQLLRHLDCLPGWIRSTRRPAVRTSGVGGVDGDTGSGVLLRLHLPWHRPVLDQSCRCRADQVRRAAPASTIVTIPNEIGQELPYPKIPGGYFPLTVRCSNLK